ncbi:cation/H(+) antiporter 19-like [Dorcoceras hygrometricum]|uniref:Cation/H(+) antiporter 19-like n=1 Tax=Dorcoceras hygrometricum TaxID=472368 RepID=A0A2Z7AMF5_9LAMI|nr:cation/H(+) antiporter 19-like [Dorcoceras hygrometricum]
MTSAVTSSFSRKLSADEKRSEREKRRRRGGNPVASYCSPAVDSADALCVDIQQSQDTSRKLQYIQTQATAHPVVSYNEPAVAIHPVASFAYPVDIESSRKKADVVESYNPDERYPVAVFEDSAEAQKAIYAKAAPFKNVDERTSVREVVKPESCCRTEKKINRRQQQRENESEVKLSITIRERA